MRVAAVIQFDELRVTIDGLLHVSLRRSDLFGIDTWIDAVAGRWCIEFTAVTGATMLAEYDTREKWIAVLEAIGEVL